MDQNNQNLPLKQPQTTSEHLAAQFEAVLGSSFDGIWICDGQGYVLRVNAASEKINGVKAAEVIGRHVSSLTAEGILDRSVTLEVLEQKRRVTIMQTALRTGAKLLVTGTPILDRSGKIMMVVTNDRDITELDNLRTNLLESRALSERYQHELVKLEFGGDHGAEVIGRSPQMRRVLAAASHVARFDTSVLLTGASGAGKTLLAKSIHSLSSRGQGPFVRVDCGSIPISLFESEVFGYERGAFTGALATGKTGLFELAHQGTLFLDDIAAVPLELQPKLLKFIENRELVRIGGHRPLKVDARLIAASNVDLEEEIAAGRFREDLFYRLNVVPLHLPDLKDRADDLPLLIHHFLDKFNEQYLTSVRFSGPVLEAFLAHDWPGNVRELRNIIERLVVMTPGRLVDLTDLPARMRPEAEPLPLTGAEGGLRAAVRRFESSLIRRALEVHGTQAKAAQALGVSQATIARKSRFWG